MFEQLSSKERLLLGLVFLLLVDLIWVASAELTEYLFKTEEYNKPFFITYIKTAMFTLYLLGFLLKKSWRQRCRWPKTRRSHAENSNNLSDPVYVPINDDDGYNSIDSSDNEVTVTSSTPLSGRKAVRFNDHTEVRVMTSADAEDANLARLSYNEFMRAQQERANLHKKFSVPTVCKLAIIFCVLWFLANFSYQEAMLNTEAGVVNALSSLSGLFTLILAAIFSSGPSDRLTLSKLIAVLFSLGGATMICVSVSKLDTVPIGCLWALAGSVAYATYLVSLKRKVPDDQQLDVPMFFGFVGLFNVLIFWPGILILHYTNWETFVFPSVHQWLIILANGLVGTVLSELLWLWGCFLSSSLLATLSLGLVSPLTMLFDVFIIDVKYGWMFYAGMAPVILSFAAISVISHYDNWDPVLIALKKCTKVITRSIQEAKMREIDPDLRRQLLPSRSAD